ncbi:hypothetical protein LJC22_01995 [Desulfosarcina sp. OttesenSCG-928-G10]|nr:hypothetical protein [Desulfosarcina sp. OttesenSCG-928-G10]
MKPEQLYQELKDLGEKLNVTISEQNFRLAGIPVKSGLCIVKGEMRCIIDKNIPLRKKINVLARYLSGLSHENLYVVPVLREVLQKNAVRSEKRL